MAKAGGHDHRLDHGPLLHHLDGRDCRADPSPTGAEAHAGECVGTSPHLRRWPGERREAAGPRHTRAGRGRGAGCNRRGTVSAVGAPDQLADLDQVPVRVAHVTADLAATVDGRSQKLRSAGPTLLVDGAMSATRMFRTLET